MGLASKVDSRDVGLLVLLAQAENFQNLRPHHDLGTILINTLTHHTLFKMSCAAAGIAFGIIDGLYGF